MSDDKKVYYIDRRFGGTDLCAHPVVDDAGQPLPNQEIRDEDDPIVQAVLHPNKDNIEVPMFYFKRYLNKLPWKIGDTTRSLLQWVELGLQEGTDAHFDWYHADRIGCQDRDVVTMARNLGINDEQRVQLFKDVAATIGRVQ